MYDGKEVIQSNGVMDSKLVAMFYVCVNVVFLEFRQSRLT